MKVPNVIISLVITIAAYALFFWASTIGGGDESTNSLMAAATFVAITFFVNFPIAWFLVNKMVKSIRQKPQ